MKEIPVEKMAFYGSVVVVWGIMTVLLHKIRRQETWWGHGLLVITAVVSLWFIPDWVQEELFSPGGVMVLGTVMPIYESVLAATSIDSTDDRSWLQYWMAWAGLALATEFIEDIRSFLPSAGEHWFQLVFFVTLWMILPFTDGADVLYRYLTKPYLTPAAKKLKLQLEGYVQVLLTLVNTSHLWVLWFVFTRFNEEERRFFVVALGTLYPIAASIVALSTADEHASEALADRAMYLEEQSFWLIYWATYMVLFAAMDYLENVCGRIPGFYSLCAAATLYLELPMFQGADVVFRRVLVPLLGQYENLLLHDAYLVRLAMERAIPVTSRSSVLARAAAVFSSSTSHVPGDSKKTT